MNPSAYEGVLDSYDSRIPAPIFVAGSRIAGGGVFFQRQVLTYGPSIAFELKSGSQGVVSVTDAVAFDFACPTYGGVLFTALSAALKLALVGAVLRITIRNTSGGAFGAGTFNAVFKTSAGVDVIATATNRTIEFEWDGTNFTEQFRGAADVAN